VVTNIGSRAWLADRVGFWFHLDGLLRVGIMLSRRVMSEPSARRRTPAARKCRPYLMISLVASMVSSSRLRSPRNVGSDSPGLEVVLEGGAAGNGGGPGIVPPASGWKLQKQIVEAQGFDLGGQSNQFDRGQARSVPARGHFPSRSGRAPGRLPVKERRAHCRLPLTATAAAVRAPTSGLRNNNGRFVRSQALAASSAKDLASVPLW